jgi:putative ABC transport system ATP-binding protein
VSVTLHKVSKVYPGTPPVRSLSDVDLEIAAGERVAVVGSSGSGKSTLLNMIAGLDRPTSGDVSVAGVNIGRLADRELAGLRAHHIGVVFQQFHLLEALSAQENVALGLFYRAQPPGRRRADALAMLERVGLAHRAHQRPGNLSGGERQRVAIARAVIGRPALLLADEPTGNLDSATGADIVALLKEVAADRTALIIVTHDPSVAAAMDRRVEMRDGRILSNKKGHTL